MTAAEARNTAESAQGKMSYFAIEQLIKKAAQDKKFTITLPSKPTTDAEQKLSDAGFRVHGVGDTSVSW